MRRSSRLFLVFTLATAVALTAAIIGQAQPAGHSKRGAGGSGFKIEFPAKGTVVNNGTLVIAKLPRALQRKGVKRVDFHYSPAGQNRFQPIAGVVPDGLADYAAIWDTDSLAGGDYVLRARLIPKGGRGRKGSGAKKKRARPRTATTTAHVNEQPFAVASAQALGFGPVRLDASRSMDRGGQIVSYQWDFGDGTTGQGAVLEHVYQRFGTFPVSVTVRDNQGGESTGHYILTTSPLSPTSIAFAFYAKEKCGCKRMRVEGAGAVEGPPGFDFSPEDSSGIPDGEKGNRGPYNDGKAGKQPELDPKKKSYTVKCRFEVIAELHEQSKPQLCSEGQRVQRTSHRGGKDIEKEGEKSLEDPRYDSSEGADDPYDPGDDAKKTEKGKCGYGNKDGTWCDDGYHGGGGAGGSGRDEEQPPNGYKTYEGQKRILWLDAPGAAALAKDELPYFFKAKFEAKVSGALGECKCSWEVLIEIDKDGKVLNNKVHKVNCTP